MKYVMYKLNYCGLRINEHARQC